jgi:hypothetical protein
MPVLRQQRFPAVVTELSAQTAPVFSWQQSSSLVQAQVASLVHRLPSGALQLVLPDDTQVPPPVPVAPASPPEQRPPQQS